MSDPITDLKRELLAAAERQHIGAAVPVRGRAFGLRVGGAPRLLAIGAALAVAALAALFFTTPWRKSPSFLEGAQAALAPPEGMILHEKWVAVDTYTDSAGRACTVRSAAEFWIDEPRQRFRALMHNAGYAPYPHPPTASEKDKLACSPQRPYEIGGVAGAPGEVFQFVPPNRVARAPSDVGWGEEADPVGELRRAIRAGEAYDEGKTTRDGRTVRRICLDASPSACAVSHFYAYVDPETFYPVEMDGGNGDVTRFLAFEHLPRTTANLALTNIRAQHPHASRP